MRFVDPEPARIDVRPHKWPGLPQGFTLADMADDYATMIREEFGRPVDVIGVSTGGSIALHFAADHPELVLASSCTPAPTP